MAPSRTVVTTSSCSLLLIYRPRTDERLSWSSWLTYSGRFTHISGHPSAVGRTQDSVWARPKRCPTLSNPVPWQNWMAAYLGYTLRMKTLFRGWPVMVHDTHTRRRRLHQRSLLSLIMQYLKQNFKNIRLLFSYLLDAVKPLHVLRVRPQKSVSA